MSRARTRPTREETRSRIIAAAMDAFVADGIGATTIESICSRAGLTRGAFYSNFESKDGLVLAVLDEHLAAQLAEMERLVTITSDALGFLQSLEGVERRREGPIGSHFTLNTELVLYAIRTPENRPRLIARRQRWHELNVKVLRELERRTGRSLPIPIEDVARFITAIDDGYAFGELVEPGSYAPGQFSRMLSFLQTLWEQSPDSPPSSP
jgi:AcrR family transcriptional regulator